MGFSFGSLCLYNLYNYPVFLINGSTNRSEPNTGLNRGLNRPTSSTAKTILLVDPSPIAAHFAFRFLSFSSFISINFFNVPNSFWISDWILDSSVREIFRSVSSAKNWLRFRKSGRLLRQAFKLMLARWRSQPIESRHTKIWPIRGRAQFENPF